MTEFEQSKTDTTEDGIVELGVENAVKYDTPQEAAADGYVRLVARDDKLDKKIRDGVSGIQQLQGEFGDIALVRAPDTIRHYDVLAREEVKKLTRKQKIAKALGLSATK